MKKKISDEKMVRRKVSRSKPDALPSIVVDQDEDVPFLAVKALNNATQKALKSGHPVAYSRNGKLDIRTADGKEKFIKNIAKRVKIDQIIKNSKTSN